MLGQLDPNSGIVPAAEATLPSDGTVPTPGGFWSQLPDLFKSYEQARLVDAATAAQVQQINRYGAINPAWIIAGVFVVLIALARR